MFCEKIARKKTARKLNNSKQQILALAVVFFIQSIGVRPKTEYQA